MRPLAWLVVSMPLLLSTACATSAAYHPQKDCAAGSPDACADWGDTLMRQGDPLQAESAYGQACDYGIATSCIRQGQLLTRRGELEAAEPPLRRAYVEEFPEAHEALADLFQARGDPRSLEIARGLRFEAPAIDKPAVEVISRYHMDARGAPGTDLLLNVQPMAFLSRRLALGFQASFSTRSSLNGFLGYQHFASPWAVPYARVMVGSALGEGLNYGGELGLKLCLGPIGHLEFAAGSSRVAPLYVSAGFGLNAVFLLLAMR